MSEAPHNNGMQRTALRTAADAKAVRKPYEVQNEVVYPISLSRRNTT